MNYILLFLAILVYSLALGYGMFQIGYNSGFARGYYYVTLVARARKNETTDV